MKKGKSLLLLLCVVVLSLIFCGCQLTSIDIERSDNAKPVDFDSEKLELRDDNLTVLKTKDEFVSYAGENKWDKIDDIYNTLYDGMGLNKKDRETVKKFQNNATSVTNDSFLSFNLLFFFELDSKNDADKLYKILKKSTQLELVELQISREVGEYKRTEKIMDTKNNEYIAKYKNTVIYFYGSLKNLKKIINVV